MNKLILSLCLMLALPAMAATGPEQLIRETSDKVVDEIKQNGDLYKNDPQGVYDLVNTLVLPHFDFVATLHFVRTNDLEVQPKGSLQIGFDDRK